MTDYPRFRITGLVLAGGQGSRMGGLDKGLVPVAGRRMVDWVVEALAPQVGPILVNANRHADQYRALGHPVIPDALGGYAGPLAGMAAGLAACTTDYLLTVPCDSPFLPPDLGPRLYAALAPEAAEVAVPTAAGRLQPVFALLDRRLLGSLTVFLESGGRKIDRWFETRRMVSVDCSDEAAAFSNVNTPEDREAAEQRLGAA